MTTKVSTVALNKNVMGDRGSVTAMATMSLMRENPTLAARKLLESSGATCLGIALLVSTSGKHTEMFCATRCAKISIAHILCTKTPTVNHKTPSTISLCMDPLNMETSRRSTSQVIKPDNVCMKIILIFVQVCLEHGDRHHKLVTMM